MDTTATWHTVARLRGAHALDDNSISSIIHLLFAFFPTTSKEEKKKVWMINLSAPWHVGIVSLYI
jgi:hypothetical protein